MTLNERTALRVLVEAYELQEQTEHAIVALLDDVDHFDKRRVSLAFQHTRSGLSLTISDLRAALKETWDNQPSLDQLTAETVAIDPGDIPRPWERYSPDPPPPPVDSSPDIIDLGADTGDDGTHDGPADD